MKGLFQCPPWEWVKDPPAGEGQVGQIQHCRAVTFSLFGQERGLVRDMELSLQGKYPLNAVLHISKKYCTFARRHHFSNFETKKRNLALHQHKLMEVIP